MDDLVVHRPHHLVMKLTIAILLLAAAAVVPPEKARMMWAIMRGNPVAYRLKIIDGTLTFGANEKAQVVECLFSRSKVGVRVTGQ